MKLAKITDLISTNSFNPDRKVLYRVGGISSLVLGIVYVITIVFYALLGSQPSGGEAWLRYFVGKSAVAWSLVGLSVLTDFLFIPVVLSLYSTLKEVSRNIILIAVAFVGLFVVLDLGVTWPNYSSLIILSGNYATASDATQQASFISAANYASAALSFSLPVYSILVLSFGILLIGLAMLRGIFSKGVAYLGLATGVIGIISVAGPFIWGTLGLAAIVTSVLTIIWLLFTGYRLYKLGRS